MAMKDLFKKMSNQDEAEDLNTGYNDDYYDGAYNEPPHRSDDRRQDDRRQDDRRQDDRRQDDRRQDDRRQDDRRQDDRRREDDPYEGYDRRDRRPGRDRNADGGYNEPYYTGRRPDYEYDEDGNRNGYDQPAGERPRKRTPVAPEPTPQNAGTLYFAPENYKDDRETIADGLRESHVVVISVAKLSQSDLIRLTDFILGVSLALEGNLYRLNRTTLVVEPKGVEVDAEDLEIPDEDEDQNEDEDSESESEDEYTDEDSEEDGTDDN